jgi:hypothetical protein
MILALQLLAAVTCGGLGGAIFTWWINRRFRLPPVLTPNLVLDEGERGMIQQQGGGFEDARYYHLRISNSRRWSPATDVQVFLVRVVERGEDGSSQVTWVGDIPMRWRNQESSTLTRTIGPAADCDLCCVGRSGWIQLLPLIIPYSLPVRRTEPCRLVMSMQVRSTQADSPIFSIEISWDGKWDDGDTEIKQHLKIRMR